MRIGDDRRAAVGAAAWLTRSRCLLAAVLSALASAAACQPCGTCNLSTLNARVVSGTVTTSIGGGPPQQLTLPQDGGVSRPPGCFIATSTVITSDNQALPGSTGPVLNCTVGGIPFALHLTDLKDMRGLSAGIGHGMLEVLQGDTSSCTGGAATSNSLFAFDVTRADGGTADFPALVTPDYVREISVHLMIDRQTSCGPASISADVELAQTAADVRQHDGCSCL